MSQARPGDYANCPGTGGYAPYGTFRGPCPACGRVLQLSAYGRVGRHKDRRKPAQPSEPARAD